MLCSKGDSTIDWVLLVYNHQDRQLRWFKCLSWRSILEDVVGADLFSKFLEILVDIVMGS